MTEALDEEALVRQSARTACRNVDGKAVVVVIDSQKMHVLNPVGTRIWELCDGRSLAAIADIIATEFEVDQPTALADTRAFASHLGTIGALEVVGR